MVGSCLLVFFAFVPFIGVHLPWVLPGTVNVVNATGTLDVLALCFVFGGVALGYDVLFGFTGLLSLGPVMYFAMGVYVFDIAMTHWNWPFVGALALTFAVATLGINVVANFVSPAFDFANVFPSKINFKRGGYIAALIALALYPFAPWEGSAAGFVGMIGATMGPLLGVILTDYYLIRKGVVDVAALYDENGEFAYSGGWNPRAVVAALVGALFSSILPNFTHWLPSWWGVYGWFFGVAIGGLVYYGLSMTRRAGA
ncbi:MAG: hypothetical protein B7X07_04460 [Actinobacteria bacterium 21-64-8]|nr:MAG: hypothetical protein B7X07_04460 [Actinobacteria bacterium 21-64-8]